eukprot:CAMPEP_0175067662 /NCGR_PEP_ID=MMETSP0052_2-20121109/17227_1 /TAXON_ID=51329 ORGANISM="Polytomella parva, Strain SAG 63-3" /NCGR_SAMPLE_ID=MMETSP0052_2 /ASSEMBLY_ACC=CAM_ASM_000194 /LENGTH=152 /DNA_ID=CAMNT_0016334577 /DNA_START=74 /DNA_END=528 /DNA_ORIENTATION=-
MTGRSAALILRRIHSAVWAEANKMFMAESRLWLSKLNIHGQSITGGVTLHPPEIHQHNAAYNLHPSAPPPPLRPSTALKNKRGISALLPPSSPPPHPSHLSPPLPLSKKGRRAMSPSSLPPLPTAKLFSWTQQAKGEDQGEMGRQAIAMAAG